MENFSQHFWLFKSRSFALIPGNNEPERAVSANSAFLQTAMNRGATIFSPHYSSAADAADPNAWANKLNKMGHDYKHAKISKHQVHNTSGSTESPTMAIGREVLKSPNQGQVVTAVETAQQDEM